MDNNKTAEFFKKTNDCLKNIKHSKPLILNITNIVTVNDVANAIIMLGGSPAMGSQAQDSYELSKIAQGIALNLGGINDEHFANFKILSKQLPLLDNIDTIENDPEYPVMTLDLVAYGATPERIKIGSNLLKHRFTAIKGNYSEITALVDTSVQVKGVDSDIKLTDPKAIIEKVAILYKTIVVMTGKIDYISDGTTTYNITGGSHYLSKITGSGCFLNGILTLCLTANRNLDGAVSAVYLLKLAGEIAAGIMQAINYVLPNKTLNINPGPYSFRNHLFDTLYQLPKLLSEDHLNDKSFKTTIYQTN